MRGRLGFLAGAAAGYVLGAKAGRSRYEQIKTQADQLWKDPKVQDTVTAAQTFVADKAKEAAPVVQEKVADAAHAATGAAASAANAVKDKVTGSKNDGDELDFSANDDNMLTGAEKGSDYSPHETKYTSD